MKMPHIRLFIKILSARCGGPSAARLARQAQWHFERLSASQPPEPHPQNQAMLQGRILPTLAIYRALMDDGFSQANALDVAGTFIRETFAVQLFGVRLLNHLPDPFPLIRPALRQMTAVEYRPGSQEITSDTADCFALNIYRCLALDVFSAHNAPELTSLLCQTDDMLAEAMSKVRWERTQTLGRGGNCCDFCWRRARA